MKQWAARSEGARVERKAIRAYLRRLLRWTADASRVRAIEDVLKWVLSRQKRYDRRPGGLGR